MTQKAKAESGGFSGSTSIEPLASSFHLPQFIFSGSSTSTIEIVRWIKEGQKSKKYTVKVDRDTGFITKSSKGFSYVAKFDPDTLPDQSHETLKKVGFWNIFNQYVNGIS